MITISKEDYLKAIAEAEAEGEREGFLTIEQVHREISDLIDELDRARV